MAALSECPVCRYQGATLPYNGDEQVQCPQCERVYMSVTADSVSSSEVESSEEPLDEPPKNGFEAMAESSEARITEMNDGESAESTDEEQFEGDDIDDSDANSDEDHETSEQSSGRIIRMHCPNCRTMVELSRRTDDVTVSSLWDRMQLQNEPIRVRCPTCSTLVQLQRRKQRKSRLPEPPTQDSFTPGVPQSALDTNGSPAHRPFSLPSPTPRSPSLAWKLLWPERFRPAPLPDESRPRSTTAYRRREPRSLPLKPVAIGAMLVAAAAIVIALATPYGVAVMPLCILAVVIALGTLSLANSTRSSRRWPLAALMSSVSVLVLVAFSPALLGEKYSFYRHPELDPEIVSVVPKTGRHDKELPADPNWVDASKFGLDRDWFHIEVNNASVGPVEVRPTSGAGAPRTEQHLTIAFSYGSVRPSKRGAVISSDHSEKLSVTVIDAKGQRFEREDLILASRWARAKEMPHYTSGTANETMVFQCPTVGDDGLRLEIRIPNLGSTPLRFIVPKTMISIQSTAPARAPAEHPKDGPARNEE